ncbi:hypothetical protein NIES4106_61740 (plasmid) [Fischerella sp. NIES-4106]|nr:hypothetical protein NIES4106_61740 [Fischerella sp. NIES-4106]
MKNTQLALLTTGVGGLLLGMMFASGAYKEPTKAISLLGIGGISAGIIAQITYTNRMATKDNQHTNQLNEVAESTKKAINTAKSQAQKAESELDTIKGENITLQKQLSELDTSSTYLESRLKEIREQLVRVTTSNAEKDSELQALNQQCEQYLSKIGELQADLEDWDKHYKDAVIQKSDERFQQLKENELATAFQAHDELIEGCFSLVERIQAWGTKVGKRNEERKKFINLTIDHMDSATTGFEKAHLEHQNHLHEQIELLNLKVDYLQKELAGDILEPTYLPKDYNQDTEISNAIAHTLFRFYKTPLKVQGFERVEDILHIGYGYSAVINPQVLLDLFQSYGKDITKSLGLYSITASLQKTSPTLLLKVRRESPKPPTDEGIYKEGLIPASQFCDRIYKALDTKQEGKPTLRVMAATGEGKGIALKNLLAYWVNLPDWEIWLSDPVDGSDEDYWDCPKIAHNPSESAKAYNKFVQLHKTRQNQQTAFTDRFVLGVFDEFDKQHDDDDKELAKAIMTAIRHTKQRQILIGQCAEVGSNGWTWDDMNNCGLLVLGNSIGTLCKHLTKDMGWTTARANQVKKAYEKFSDWARKNNEANPDIPNENKYRIGLLVVSGRYEFLEIPNAHKGIIRSSQALIRDSLSTNTHISVFSNSLTTELNSVQNASLRQILQCPNPDCLSDRVGNKNAEYHRCLDCGKTWKKKSI